MKALETKVPVLAPRWCFLLSILCCDKFEAMSSCMFFAAVAVAFVVLVSRQIKEQLEADAVTVVDMSGDGRHVW
jgi:hypothetical protein